ncbi:hypothetical protein BJV78DRAFT_1156190 [Lactifluus subvellereus]|nr:hypothetical protein BJV78DRAFT_1156190 [Lactifluus subvellereus]
MIVSRLCCGYEIELENFTRGVQTLYYGLTTVLSNGLLWGLDRQSPWALPVLFSDRWPSAPKPNISTETLTEQTMFKIIAEQDYEFAPPVPCADLPRWTICSSSLGPAIAAGSTNLKSIHFNSAFKLRERLETAQRVQTLWRKCLQRTKEFSLQGPVSRTRHRRIRADLLTTVWWWLFSKGTYVRKRPFLTVIEYTNRRLVTLPQNMTPPKVDKVPCACLMWSTSVLVLTYLLPFCNRCLRGLRCKPCLAGAGPSPFSKDCGGDGFLGQDRDST